MGEKDIKRNPCKADENTGEKFFGFDREDKEVSGFDTAEWTGEIESGNK